MMKKYYNLTTLARKLFFLLLLMGFSGRAQVPLLTENFDAMSNGNLPSGGWQVYTIDGGDNWGVYSSSCAISGRSLQVCDGTTTCDYNTSTSTDKVAYKALATTGYSTLKLSFKWKCKGENFFGSPIDYGRVCYSTDGINWTNLSGSYFNQTSVQQVTDLVLPAAMENLGTIYIGFRWSTITIFGWSTGTPPGFIVDDVSITGVYQPVVTSFSPTSVCPGDTVVITGANFTGATAVSVGNTAVSSFVVNSATQITAVVGTGTTGVVKVSRNALSGSSTSPLTINALPATPNATTNTPQCTAVTFTGTAPANVTWYWQTAVGGTSTATPYASGNTKTATGTYYLRAKSDAGCWSSATQSISIVVNNAPVVSTNPSNMTVAAGGNTTFTGAFSNAPTSYTWQVSTNGGTNWTNVSNGGVYSGATTASLTLTGVTAAMNTYKYRLIATNGCGNSTSSSPATLTVTLSYCIPYNKDFNNVYFTQIQFMGLQTDLTNISSFSNNPKGYKDYTDVSPVPTQYAGEAVNIYFELISGQSSQVMAWIDLNQDGDFTDGGEIIYTSGSTTLNNATFGQTIPPNQPTGYYTIRIRCGDNWNDPCAAPSGSTEGETEDYRLYIIARCPAEITSVTNGTRCGSGLVTLAATGTGVSQYKWYDGAGTLLATTPTDSYDATVTATTAFYVTGWNGSCETQVKKKVMAYVKPVPAVTFTPAAPVVCGTIEAIKIAATSDPEIIYLIDEGFNSGLGSFNTATNGLNNSGNAWTPRTSSYTNNSSGGTWKPAISSGFGANGFVMCTSDTGTISSGNVNSSLITPAINTTGFTNLTLAFRMYFSKYGASDVVNVEVSTDGGFNWMTTPSLVQYTADQGTPAAFADLTVDLSTYVNQSNLKLRFRYYTPIWADGVAIDDVQVYGSKPNSTSFNWTTANFDAFNDNAGVPGAAYTQGSMASTIWLKPHFSALAQLTSSDKMYISINTQLTNGCSQNQVLEVTSKTRIWNGGSNGNWNNGNNWAPQTVPSLDDCVYVNNVATISDVPANTTVFAKNMTVMAGGKMVVNSGATVQVNDWITVESGGTATFEHNSSLLQINTGTNINTGSIIYKRNTPAVTELDYIYWASPVEGMTLGTLSPLSAGYYYSWGTTDWVLGSTATAMTKGRGFIARSPNDVVIPTVFNGQFTGKPHNGTVSLALNARAASPPPGPEQGWNLLGNPYPSAISAYKFLSDATNLASLDGALYLWMHINPPTNTLNNDPNYLYEYNPGDYAAINYMGSTNVDLGYVAAGQAFFARSKAGTSGLNAAFTNDMRVIGNNNNFIKPGPSKYATSSVMPVEDEPFEKHRFWLDIYKNQGAHNQTLIGYAEGASNAYEQGYDAELMSESGMALYSLIAETPMVIQGRALPFVDTDAVALGYKTATAGQLKIVVDHFDPLFENQDIFLHDLLLNVYQDIKAGPYVFASGAGTFNDRFEIVYVNSTLGIENPQVKENAIVVYNQNAQLHIDAGNYNMKAVQVFDIAGRLIYTQKDIVAAATVLDGLSPKQQTLIVHILTDTGVKVYKKVLY